MNGTQFTRLYVDHSTQSGYQFEFHCDKCSRSVMSSFRANNLGAVTEVASEVGWVLGGFIRSVSAGASALNSLTQGAAHDQAFQAVIEEVKPNFQHCPACGGWVCATTCFDHAANLCKTCAAQQVTVTTCPSCNAHVSDGKFCPECGQSLAPTTCHACGAALTPGTKFCPECGKPVERASG